MSDEFGDSPHAADEVTRRLAADFQAAARGQADWYRAHGRALDLGVTNYTDADDLAAIRTNLSTDPSRPLPPPGPDGRRFPRYTPDAAELQMRARHLVGEDRLTGTLPESANGVYVMRANDDSLNIFKPFSEEDYNGYNWLPHEPGELAKRAGGGYRVFEMLGFHARVPPTIVANTTYGQGSLQPYMPLKASKPWNQYPKRQQQQAALGHFIIGNADGHEDNYRPMDYGDRRPPHKDDLVVYDLDYSFPESPDYSRGHIGFEFRSDFVKNYTRAEFDEDLLRGVDALHPDRMGSALEDLQLSDNAISWARKRLIDVQEARTIPYM